MDERKSIFKYLKYKKMKQKLIDFIKDNNLKFTVGQRNTDSVILSGYALYLGVENVTDLYECVVIGTNSLCSSEFEKELNKVFNYAKSNNYDKWWLKEEAKIKYKF